MDMMCFRKKKLDLKLKPKSPNIELNGFRADADGVNIFVYSPISFDDHDRAMNSLKAKFGSSFPISRGGWGNDIENEFNYGFKDIKVLHNFLEELRAEINAGLYRYSGQVDLIGYDEQELNKYFRRSQLHMDIDSGLQDGEGK
jgi:hypothetical protein